MSEEKELTILEEMDKLLARIKSELNEGFIEEDENTDNHSDYNFLSDVRDELFAKTNYNKSLIQQNKDNIEELNAKTEKIIELNDILAGGEAANREMFVTLQHVGGIFNRMFDEISAAAKGTDFVDTGAITKILNNNKKFEIDESVFDEEVLVEHSVDTSFEG